VEAGVALNEANSFYHNFGDMSGHFVRVFYKVFQVNGSEQNTGPGIYIHKLKKFDHNRNNIKTGLFNRVPNGLSWNAASVSGSELTSAIMRIGSAVGASG